MTRIRRAVTEAILAVLAIAGISTQASAATGDGGLTTLACTELPRAYYISDVRSYEGSGGGHKAFVFTVSTAQCADAATVSWTTQPANGNADYLDAGGTLTWAAGDMSSRTITVLVARDNVDEFNETFTVALLGPVFNPSGPGEGTILDDDGPMKWNANPVSCQENNPAVAAFVPCTYTITRSTAAVASTIRLHTADVTATQPADYLPLDITHPVAAGVVTVTGTVWIRTDLLCEGNHDLLQVLDQQSHGMVMDPSERMTIVDDDLNSCVS